MAGTGMTHVTVVTARSCHFCEDARQALAELGRFHPFAVEEMAAHSPAGQAMVLEHGNGMYPLVMVDGAFFSAGRLPRRKLARLLDRLATLQHPAEAGAR